MRSVHPPTVHFGSDWSILLPFTFIVFNGEVTQFFNRDFDAVCVCGGNRQLFEIRNDVVSVVASLPRYPLLQPNTSWDFQLVDR